MTNKLATGPLRRTQVILSHGDPNVRTFLAALSDNKIPTPAALSSGNFGFPSTPTTTIRSSPTTTTTTALLAANHHNYYNSVHIQLPQPPQFCSSQLPPTTTTTTIPRASNYHNYHNFAHSQLPQILQFRSGVGTMESLYHQTISLTRLVYVCLVPDARTYTDSTQYQH